MYILQRALIHNLCSIGIAPFIDMQFSLRISDFVP